MATIPGATTQLSATGAAGSTSGLCAVFACVPSNADITPRVYTSWKALKDQHGYAPGVDYSALHLEKSRKGIIFTGLPISTPGAVSSTDSTGVTGTSAVSVSVGASGSLEAVDGTVTVVVGGTVGTVADGVIAVEISLDGGLTQKRRRIGEATSYVIPDVGITIAFGAGTLVAGDVFRFKTTAPQFSNSDIALARAALADQLKPTRSWLFADEVADVTAAGVIVTAANAFATTDDRFTLARVNIKDRGPLPTKSKVKNRMSGSPQLTFAEVGATGDTITRATGSWITDGFAIGDLITVAGTVSNNFTDKVIANLSATVITLDTQDLVAEVITTGVSVVGSESLTFAEVGATDDTVTRSSGSWITDGFAVGDVVAFTGTASNNVTGAIKTLSATVLTFDTTDLTAEVIAGWRVSVTKVQTMSAWVSAVENSYSTIADEPRVSLGLGRATKESPITGWQFRRPAAWADSIRSYERDIHQTTWEKEVGPLSGWGLHDADGDKVEYDERTVGGALAGRFTCFRTWNDSEGTFIAKSVTRGSEDTVLAMTHNMEVANVACTVVQSVTSNFVGKTPQIDSAGHMLSGPRGQLEARVNTKLAQELLQEKVPGAGPRASSVVWKMSVDDVLNVADATVTGVCTLNVNGTIVNVDTLVKVS